MSSRLPLSIQQEWLWDVMGENLHWQCAAARAFRLRGSLDIPLLEQCLHEVVRCHSALRTHIADRDGSVWQEIRDQPECVLEIETVRGTSAAEVTANARDCVESRCDRKIDPSIGPLWNAVLLRLSEYEHWLVFAMHRLIGDCVSIDQTYHETKSLYAERREGGLSPLQSPAQYSDYTAWQQQTSLDWANRHEPYWKRQLAEAVSVQWSTEADSRATSPGVLGKVDCAFGAALSAGLRGLARAVRTLAAVPMLAIYALVLWRWCRQSDFVLPLNTAGRPSGYKSAIGYFSYALFLRIELRRQETYRQFVSRVGNEFFSSLSHQDFGRLARQRPDLLSGTLFQWVTWQPEGEPDECVDVRNFGEGLTVLPPGMTGVEVTVFDTVAGLHAFGSYRADYFAPGTMERFMADLRWAAELFVNNPDSPIAAVVDARGGGHEG